MSTNTSTMAMGKAVDGDNARTYLETTLGSALDKIDAHDHSGTTHGVSALNSLTGLGVGGAAPSTGGVGIQTQGASTSRVKLGGTGVVAGDFALSAGWGSTGAVAISATGSNDSRGAIQITVGGSSIAANPTVVFTFKDGTWATAPVVLSTLVDNAGTANAVAASTVTATAVTFTFYGTPTTAHQYILSWIAFG